jgi:hypothetical protein
MNGPNPTSGPHLQDTMESLLFPDREVPVTGDGTLDEMDRNFQQHCSDRLSKLLDGANQMLEVEEPSVSNKES